MTPFLERLEDRLCPDVGGPLVPEPGSLPFVPPPAAVQWSMPAPSLAGFGTTSDVTVVLPPSTSGLLSAAGVVPTVSGNPPKPDVPQLHLDLPADGNVPQIPASPTVDVGPLCPLS